jgi:hypothetical protein
LLQFNGQAALEAHVPPARAAMVPHQVDEIGRQDAPQPGHQLGFAFTTKLAEVPMRLQKRFLHHVGGVHFAMQPTIDLEPGQQRQVTAIQLQQPAQRIDRIEGLLSNSTSRAPDPEMLRRLRAVQVLDQIATQEARELPQTLANGAAGDRVTREAKAALQQLNR